MSRTMPGDADLRLAAEHLAARLPAPLAPFARVAFDYRWSWTPGGDALFAAVDPTRWQASGRNPVRLLREASTAALERAAEDGALVERARAFEAALAGPGPRLPGLDGVDPERPVAFLCAEYGVHVSLPIYAGGLGVLAGDLLKAASDSGVPLVAVGLLYGQGYFRQRIDLSGWQNEYWVETDAPRLPGARVTRDGGAPLEVRVPIGGHDVVAHVWRFAIGRTPLFLLDTDVPDNAPMDRWITSRLYVPDPHVRLAQYALLGIGGVRALRALGIEPSVFHLNEGHAALAPLELASEAVARGEPFEKAFDAARERTVFTTHTPVPAGNETYAPEQVKRVFEGLDGRLDASWDALLGLARTDPDDGDEPPGMTCLALRASRHRNGVSRRHGDVARALWRPVFDVADAHDVPIGHVTNGVHLGTWMAGPMRALLERHLGAGWEAHVDEPAFDAGVDAIPDAELWQVRCELRARLVEYVRERATFDRLARGEGLDYVEQAQCAFDPERLTVGFARRLATYKRLYLLERDLPRSLELLRDGLQIVLAGKAHPADENAKHVVQGLFQARHAPAVGDRVAYLHDYDVHMASLLVSGCDVWVNVPRPPLEASGTSGMKAAMNGCLNLSVLDGWWAEAWDESHGWALPGEEDPDHEAQDERDARTLLDLLEQEVLPLFRERDADGVPRAWVARAKAAIRAGARRFSARRMLRDYVEQAYRA